MKAFSTKIMLLCGVFLTLFTCLSAQTGFLCDTVILKSGGLMFVKIVDTRSDIIAYRECTMDNNLTLYSLDLNKIREIRKAYVEQYVYNLKPEKSRPLDLRAALNAAPPAWADTGAFRATTVTIA